MYPIKSALTNESPRQLVLHEYVQGSGHIEVQEIAHQLLGGWRQGAVVEQNVAKPEVQPTGSSRQIKANWQIRHIH